MDLVNTLDKTSEDYNLLKYSFKLYNKFFVLYIGDNRDDTLQFFKDIYDSPHFNRSNAIYFNDTFSIDKNFKSIKKINNISSKYVFVFDIFNTTDDLNILIEKTKSDQLIIGIGVINNLKINTKNILRDLIIEHFPEALV